MRLRDCYAVHGTELAYAATRPAVYPGRAVGYRLRAAFYAEHRYGFRLPPYTANSNTRNRIPSSAATCCCACGTEIGYAMRCTVLRKPVLLPGYAQMNRAFVCVEVSSYAHAPTQCP
eukprot:1341616-Rhodomonas_salina.3